MSNADTEFDRLRREFGYHADSYLIRSDSVLRAPQLSAATVNAFDDAVQDKIAKAAESSWWYRVVMRSSSRN